MISAHYSKFVLVFFVAFMSSLAGCHGSKASVEGTVTLDGQPIDDGALAFRASGKPVLSATIREGGKYQLEQAGKSWVEPGQYSVTVRGYKPDPNTDPNVPPNPKVITPEKYASATTSGLSAEVKSGSNSFDFDLKSAE